MTKWPPHTMDITQMCVVAKALLFRGRQDVVAWSESMCPVFGRFSVDLLTAVMKPGKNVTKQTVVHGWSRGSAVEIKATITDARNRRMVTRCLRSGPADCTACQTYVRQGQKTRKRLRCCFASMSNYSCTGSCSLLYSVDQCSICAFLCMTVLYLQATAVRTTDCLHACGSLCPKH